MKPPGQQTAKALRKSNVSRYIQLAGEFRHRIESGVWPVGSQIPTVLQLSEQCGVATMTIRQALGELESEGLIERLRAKGTFVRSLPDRDLWCQVETDWSGLLNARPSSSIEILEVATGQTLPRIDELSGTPASEYRYLRRLHSRAGQAFALGEIYLDERLTGFVAPEAYANRTAMRILSEIPGLEIGDARQIVTVAAADLETSTFLDLPVGAPVAHVKRMALNPEGEVLLLAEGIYRGDRAKIEVKLR